MGNCKAIAIQTYLDTFRHNQAYLGIIQAYSKPCVTTAYLEPWYIQNVRLFRTLAYSKSEAYSETCQTPTMKHFVKIVNPLMPDGNKKVTHT